MLDCNALKAACFFMTPENPAVTAKAYQKAGEHYAAIDCPQAARRLGRAIVFYRTHKLWLFDMLQRIATQDSLKKLSDISLEAVLGFNPGEDIFQRREASAEQPMPSKDEVK